MKRGGTIIFVVYLLFGIYFINYAFNFVVLPDIMNTLNKWVVFAGGVLILIGGINFLRSRRERRLFY